MNTTKINESKPNKPKGRPKCFDRCEALDHALQVFYEKGYESTSIAELGAAMNMNPPSLYNAFGDKEKLFIEVLEHYHKPHLDNLRALFSESQDARQAIWQLIENAKRSHSSSNSIGCLVVNSTVNVGSEQSPIADKIKSLHDATEKLIYERLKVGQQQGEIASSVKVAKLARYLYGVLVGAAALARSQKSAAAKDLLDQGYLGFLSLAGIDHMTD